MTGDEIQEILRGQINDWVVGSQTNKWKLANTINELVLARIKEALADAEVVGDKIWDGS